jgi:uncharacterized protein
LKALDTNILVYAHRKDSPWHEAAAAVLKELAEGAEPWAIPWPCLHEFYSVVTHPRIYKPPTPPEVAIRDLENWMESPMLRMIGETGPYWEVLGKLLRRSGVAGPMVHDARIAAICRANGVRVLLSADRDFMRFGIEVRNPLVQEEA